MRILGETLYCKFPSNAIIVEIITKYKCGLFSNPNGDTVDLCRVFKGSKRKYELPTAAFETVSSTYGY